MDFLRVIIKSLNMVEVKGADNMDRLLGCIQGLERLDREMEAGKNDHHDEPEQDVHGTVD